ACPRLLAPPPPPGLWPAGAQAFAFSRRLVSAVEPGEKAPGCEGARAEGSRTPRTHGARRRLGSAGSRTAALGRGTRLAHQGG
ncbi:hypothetical protein P7K49_015467, partial [Saguinus oedipus]